MTSAAAAAVGKRRLALERQLHRALDAGRSAQEHMLRALVAWGARVRWRRFVFQAPGANEQSVLNGEPPGRGHPGGLEHQRTRQVAPLGRYPAPAGPRRKCPALRSRITAKTLSESMRGAHSHSTLPAGEIKALVSQSDRNA
jgi:hypothetical protein